MKERRNSRNLMLVTLLVLSVLTAIIAGTFFATRKPRYIQNYKSVLQLNSFGYDAVVKKFGEPDTIKFVQEEGYYNRIRVYYESVNFDFLRIKDDASIVALGVFEITGEQYKLGRKKIGVGSTRDEVIAAYKDIRLISDEGIGPGDGYFEKPTFVWFFYDENDVVKSIRIVLNGP
jgi:hypothetical protein